MQKFWPVHPDSSPSISFGGVAGDKTTKQCNDCFCCVLFHQPSDKLITGTIKDVPCVLLARYVIMQLSELDGVEPSLDVIM